MDTRLLELMVCPVCKGSLERQRVQGAAHTDELWCRVDRLAFPIKDGIPVMLEEEARPLADTELEA